MVSHCACPTRGVRDRALHEHRRASNLPSPISFKGSLVDPRVRASNQHFLILYISPGEWPRLPFTLRASSDHHPSK